MQGAAPQLSHPCNAPIVDVPVDPALAPCSAPPTRHETVITEAVDAEPRRAPF